MDWMESGDSAKPVLWIASDSNVDEDFINPEPLSEFCHDDNGRPDVLKLSRLLEAWTTGPGTSSAGSIARGGTVVSFPVAEMKLHIDHGCVSVRGVLADGSLALTGIVSCPRWYYCGNSALSCMLPLEAIECMREIAGPAWEGLCPDLIMNPRLDGGAERERAKTITVKLYELARQDGARRFKANVAKA